MADVSAAGGGKRKRGGLQRKITGEIKRREAESQVLELARMGLTYEAIAKALGYKSKGSIHHIIHRALDRIPVEAAEAYRKAEDQRIEALMSIYLPLAMRGEIDAARFVDQLIGRRAKLMGLNAPERAPVDENGEAVGGSDALADFYARVRSAIARSGAGGAAGDGHA